MTDIVWTRRLGDKQVTVIDEGSGWWPVDRALGNVPEEQWRPLIEADAQGRLKIGFNVVHIATPGASILVDTGFGPFDVNDPKLPPLAITGIELTGGIEAGLEALGVRPEDITHVLITHLHGDHIVGATKIVDGKRVPTYPKARYYVMEDEWHSAPVATTMLAEEIQPQMDTLVAAGAVELVTGEREIVPGVTFLPAPGESVGHAIVRVEGGGEVFYYVGDLFHQPAEFEHLDWMPRFRDAQTLISVRQRLLPRFVSERAIVMPAHHAFPAVGHVESAGDAYRWVPLR